MPSESSQPHDAHTAPVPQTDLSTGLTSAQAAALLEQFGHNEVSEKRSSALLRFAKKFWGLSAWMIEAIILLSWILQRYPDLYIVSALLVINAVLSFMQEERASAVVDTLRSRLQVDARVLRDGTWRALPARDLVPGDVVRLRAGDLVPADMHLMQGALTVDQSALTGESEALQRSSGETLYAASVVRRGEATGIVTLTGAGTYFGRTTELVQLARPTMQIEKVVSRLVRWLFIIVGVLLAVALVVAGVRGASLVDLLPLVLVLLLGAVPVALPVMFTVSMALGSRDLAKKNVLVTRLTASEDAATMDVLCVDKTGTITTNQLAVANVLPLNGYTADDVIMYGLCASEQANQDPIDDAFIAEARRRGLDRHIIEQLTFSPFDPATRRTEARVRVDGMDCSVTKGAVIAVAEASDDPEHASSLEAQANAYAAQGHRTIAVARADEDGGPLRLVGLVSLQDMVRPDSATFISALEDRGVDVKMLTGDAVPIAREVAAQVGLGTTISRADELERLAGSDLQAAATLAEASDGFAAIYPEGKYTVVRALQAKGHVVGMTGDGVNDAPALHQAEVGIAVSNATDVAKGAASVVLTSEGLSSIVALVDNGRQIHQRIATWIVNKVSRTILKTSFVVGAYLLTGEYVISALAMLMMIFMTDFVKISLSTDNVRGSSAPASWEIGAPVKVAVVIGVLMVIEAFGLLAFGLRHLGLSDNLPALHTYSFLILFYFAMFSILVIRERDHFWRSRPSRTLSLAISIDLAVGTCIAIIGIPGLVRLPWQHVLMVLGAAALFALLINDQVKVKLARLVGFAP